jgi:hypothetical protein
VNWDIDYNFNKNYGITEIVSAIVPL